MKKLKETLELTNNIGSFIEYWGFKSIHGRLWTLIYLSKAPISAPELMETLGVSKGLVSVAINELLDFGLIEKVGKAPGGGHTYTAIDDMGSVVREVLRQRELKLLADTEQNIERLMSFSPQEIQDMGISLDRLNHLRGLTQVHKQLLQAFVAQGYSSISEWIKFIRHAIKSTI